VRVRRLIPGAAAVLALLVVAPPAAGALRFKRCGGFGYACARLSVPLDRSGTTRGRISLAVQRLRAQRRPRRGATFVLAGGPGQSATAAFEGDGLGQLAPAFRNRDLLVFDQRGTGRSGVLRCRKLERANILSARDEAAQCAQGLGPRRAFYTSRDSVDDIEAIRQQLRIDKIALFGTSYGTKVALGYALTYPQHVERLVLDSVVEAEGPDPLYLDSFPAVSRALRALCRTGCRRITQDPVADVQALVTRLTQGDIKGPLVRSNGKARSATLNRGSLFATLLVGDFDPASRAAFPAAVRAALRGDPAPILRLKRRAIEIESPAPDPRALSAGLYAATTCEESPLPWDRASPFEERRARARARALSLSPVSFSPFDPLTATDTDLLKLCARWPAASTTRGFGPGPLPNVPVLLLEGEDDLRTPVENAQRVASLFPQARLYVAPGTGHSALGSDASGCMERAFARFFRGRRMPRACRRRRKREFRPAPVPPLTLKEVPRAGRVSGKTGRALGAVALTLDDVSEDLFSAFLANFDEASGDARGGGLRGGRYLSRGSGTLSLDGVEFVPGVRVSGRIRSFQESGQKGRLRITGRATPNGRLSIRGNRVRGRLGRRRVRARLPIESIVVDLTARASRLPGRRGR
jgi:pimeloyl-ACP methyl ester carboxylesterase